MHFFLGSCLIGINCRFYLKIEKGAILNLSQFPPFLRYTPFSPNLYWKDSSVRFCAKKKTIDCQFICKKNFSVPNVWIFLFRWWFTQRKTFVFPCILFQMRESSPRARRRIQFWKKTVNMDKIQVVLHWMLKMSDRLTQQKAAHDILSSYGLIYFISSVSHAIFPTTFSSAIINKWKKRCEYILFDEILSPRIQNLVQSIVNFFPLLFFALNEKKERRKTKEESWKWLEKILRTVIPPFLSTFQ